VGLREDRERAAVRSEAEVFAAQQGRIAVHGGVRVGGQGGEQPPRVRPDGVSATMRRTVGRLRRAWLRPGTIPRMNRVSSLPTQKVGRSGQRRNSGSAAAASVM
jgi:hypothetical protein